MVWCRLKCVSITILTPAMVLLARLSPQTSFIGTRRGANGLSKRLIRYRGIPPHNACAPDIAQELRITEAQVQNSPFVHGDEVQAASRRARSAVGRAPACVGTACCGGRGLTRWPEP